MLSPSFVNKLFPKALIFFDILFTFICFLWSILNFVCYPVYVLPRGCLWLDFVHACHTIFAVWVGANFTHTDFLLNFWWVNSYLWFFSNHGTHFGCLDVTVLITRCCWLLISYICFMSTFLSKNCFVSFSVQTSFVYFNGDYPGSF